MLAQKGQLISCDFYGPLPTSIGEVQYITVFIDNFMTYIKLYERKKATSKAVIKKL